jgi:protein TonB
MHDLRRATVVFPGASPNAHLLIGELPGTSQLRTEWRVRLSGAALPLVAIGIVLMLASRIPVVQHAVAREVHERFNVTLVDLTFLEAPGPGGGGGGGGNKNPNPPRLAEAPGRDKATIPAARPRIIERVSDVKDTPVPLQEVNIPVQNVSMGLRELPGVLTGMPSGTDPTSLGSGEGTGAGTGRGSGIGSGTGSGLGRGSGGGMGGDVYRPGNGISSPQLLQEVKPQYTAGALRERLQGMVVMEAVVMPDGSVGAVRITRSLDTMFGLDQEAIIAVKQWRFRPGVYRGRPVAVLVVVELTFALR